ncbi:RBBP9/YdeN family alpha/beta hydrolase [Kitasatospora sp. NPDC048365]|uniref:RBBP9/YdeN family alpha/beta hydrolase n=1 Tax=Kitasatospora sp. NPDC048365 TaxID=3364050 RepID=UPI00371B9E06
MDFLILHGWQNRRPADHWQHWLAGQLTGLGHHVDYPQLPDPDEPRLEAWLGELERLPARPGGRTVLCHSLGCLLWLHALDRGLPVAAGAERVLLIAPPSPEVTAGIPEIAGFAPPTAVRPGPSVRLVAADDDPYCPGGALTAYAAPLGLDADLVPGGAHLNPDSGYGPWPALLAWCLDPPVRVTGRDRPGR